MSSEYEPVFGRGGEVVDDLESVRDVFGKAAAPFTRSPWSWLTWAFLLPLVALTTRSVLVRFGAPGVVLAWCGTIILGGAVEVWAVRPDRQTARTTLAGWALRAQANLSFVAVVISAALIWADRINAVPGVWLLVLGHSFLLLGGLAFAPFKRAGWIYQVAGVVALWPSQDGLVWFAVATCIGNLWIGLSVRSMRAGKA